MKFLRTVQTHHQSEIILLDDGDDFIIQQRAVGSHRIRDRLAMKPRQLLRIRHGKHKDIFIQQRFAAEQGKMNVLRFSADGKESVDRLTRHRLAHQPLIGDLVATGSAITVLASKITGFGQCQFQLRPRRRVPSFQQTFKFLVVRNRRSIRIKESDLLQASKFLAKFRIRRSRRRTILTPNQAFVCLP